MNAPVREDPQPYQDTCGCTGNSCIWTTMPGYNVIFHRGEEVSPNLFADKVTISVVAFQDITMRVHHYAPELLPEYLLNLLLHGPMEPQRHIVPFDWHGYEIGTIPWLESRNLGKYIKMLTYPRMLRQSEEMGRELLDCDPGATFNGLNAAYTLGEMMIRSPVHVRTTAPKEILKDWNYNLKMLTPKAKR